MGTKKVDFNKSGIGRLPDNKPVVYKIETEGGKTNYAGVAKRGRVRERIQEHLGNIPGSSVRIEQMGSIREAQQKEERIIKRSQPKYNKQGK